MIGTLFTRFLWGRLAYCGIIVLWGFVLWGFALWVVLLVALSFTWLLRILQPLHTTFRPCFAFRAVTINRNPVVDLFVLGKVQSDVIEAFVPGLQSAEL